MRCSFAAKGDFRAIYAINARVSGGGAAGRNDDVTRKETELHKAAGNIVGQIEMIEHAGFAFGELGECTRRCVIWHGR
jgi:hypothetical protein